MEYPLIQNVTDQGLRIVVYNAYCRPSLLFNEGQNKRCAFIPKTLTEQIKYVDIFVFCEIFDNTCKQIIKKEFEKLGYYFVSPTVGEKKRSSLCPLRLVLINGGVFIVSKLPLLGTDEVIFEGSEITGTDSLAAKGVLYTKILKGRRLYHIFATHLCAWDKNHLTRIKEIKTIKEFIDSKEIPFYDTVLLTGDLNVNKYNTNNADEMNSCLETFLPEIHGESSLYTHNPFENSIASKHSQQKKWLDYILISKNHKEPSQDSYVFTFPLTCPSFFKINKLPFPIPKWCSPYYHSFDLSDHYPVLCHIETQP